MARCYGYGIEFNADIFDWIRESLVSGLGSETAREAGEVQNRVGASFDQVLSRWAAESTAISLVKRREDNVTEGLLTVRYRELAALVPPPRKAKPPW